MFCTIDGILKECSYQSACSTNNFTIDLYNSAKSLLLEYNYICDKDYIIRNSTSIYYS